MDRLLQNEALVRVLEHLEPLTFDDNRTPAPSAHG
jgi:hypothetical protein